MLKAIKCIDCGRIYEDGDPMKEVQEYRGECWGTPAYETMYYCWCGSDDFEDVEEDEEDADND